MCGSERRVITMQQPSVNLPNYDIGVRCLARDQNSIGKAIAAGPSCTNAIYGVW